MRTLSAAIAFALLAFFISSCSQPSGPAAAGDKSFGANTPSGTPENANSSHTLATPVLSGLQNGAGQIDLSWPNGRTAASVATGGQYYPTQDFSGAISQQHSHTDIYWWVDGAWTLYGTKYGQSTSITGLADGTYYFYVKEKSKADEQGGETFHSRNSNMATVTVTSCTVQYNVSGISSPSWANNRGVNPSFTPTFNGQGEYTSGNYQVVVCAGTANGYLNLALNLAATCSGTASGRNDVTGQVYNGASVVGSAITGTWDGTKYSFANMEYPSGVGTWSIKIKVGGVDVMTPIELTGVSNDSWIVTAGSVPSGTVNLSTNALTRKAHTGKDFNFTFTIAPASTNCNQTIVGRTVRMKVNNPNETLAFKTAAEPDPVNLPGTYKFVGSNGIPYAVTSSVPNNTVLTVDFEILNPVTNQYETIESGWTFKPTP